MNPTYDFAGQVALVTGGAPAWASPLHAFAEAGAAVVIADINDHAWYGRDELTAGPAIMCLGFGDVSDEDSVAAMVKATVEPLVGSIWRSTTPASRFHPATLPTNQRDLRPGQRDQPARGVGLHET